MVVQLLTIDTVFSQFEKLASKEMDYTRVKVSDLGYPVGWTPRLTCSFLYSSQFSLHDFYL